MSNPKENALPDERPTVLVIDLIRNLFGGIEQVMLILLPLVNQKWRVVFCDLLGHPEHAEILRKAGVEILHLLPQPRRNYIGGKGTLLRPFLVGMKLPWLLISLFKLRRWIRSNRPDVIYFNRFEVIRACMPAIGGKIPCVFHSHGYQSASDIPQRFIRLLGRRFPRIMAVSRHTLECLVEAGVPRQKISVVYNAIDINRIHAASHANGFPLPARGDNDVVFLQVAVIVPHKGHQIAIDGLSRLSNPKTKFWICGDVPSPADASRLTALKQRVHELGLDGRVEFLGWRTDVPHVMRMADIVILPSRLEGLPMALVEAMAMGKPIIGTTSGGVPELVQDGLTGVICAPTVEALVPPMELLSQSADLRQEMGERGMSRARDMFAPPHQAAQVIEILNLTRASVLEE